MMTAHKRESVTVVAFRFVPLILIALSSPLSNARLTLSDSPHALKGLMFPWFLNALHLQHIMRRYADCFRPSSRLLTLEPAFRSKWAVYPNWSATA